MLPDLQRFLVLTPALDGRDGISEVSRQVVGALLSAADANAVETWAYRGALPAAAGRDRIGAFQTAHGDRRRMLGWALRRALQRQDDLTVVVMHVHLAPIARLLSLRGAKQVVFLHGIEAWRPLRRRERLALSGKMRMLANSTRTATLFKTANPTLPEPTVCLLGVGPGVPPVRWAGEPGFALIVGRLAAAESYKGHDVLIDAWPLVLAAVPGAKLVIAGDGDDRRRLRDRVDAANLASAITFVGRVSDAELRGLYAACSAFVMPSSGEGFGLVYLEAMREAKPCVALRAAEEIVVDGGTGVLLDSAEPAAVADALIRLFRDPALRHRLGAAGALRLRSMFEERHFARRFTEAIGLPPTTPNRIGERRLAAGA